MTARFMILMIIMGVSVYLAEEKNRKLNEQVVRQEGFLELIQYVRRSVSAYRIPLDDIYQDFDHKALRENGFISCLCREGLYNAYMKFRDTFSYDEETERRLILFLRNLGNLSLSEETAAQEGIYRDLRDAYDRKRGSLVGEKRVNLTIGFTVGLGLVILFL